MKPAPLMRKLVLHSHCYRYAQGGASSPQPSMKASTVDEKARPALSLLPLCARGRFLSKAQHEAGTTDEKNRPASSLLQLQQEHHVQPDQRTLKSEDGCMMLIWLHSAKPHRQVTKTSKALN